jgi:subtilase family serine protease
MSWKRHIGVGAVGVALAVASAMSIGGQAAFAASAAAHSGRAAIQPAFKIHRIGTLPNGSPKVTNGSPTGLPPSAIKSVYNLSGLAPGSNAGAGETIAIVDASNDPDAAADISTFSTEYGIPALPACTSLTQAGACFAVEEPSGKPAGNSD